MKLQGKARAGVYTNPLDLETRATVDTLVITPWPVNLAMGRSLFALITLQLVNNRLDVLGMGLRGHHHSIRGFDDNNIIQTYQRNQPMFSQDQTVFHVTDEDITNQAVLILIFIQDLIQGVPGADITPGGIQRDDNRL